MLINVCINNALLLARSEGYKDDLLIFTRSVALDWLDKYGTKPSAGGRPSNSIITTVERHDNIGHTIVKMENNSRRRCRQCSSQTTFICKKCDAPLHVKCSVDYHKTSF